MDARCYYCERPADFLCDFVLDMAALPSKPITNDMSIDEFTNVLLNPKEVYLQTCDRPLCEHHRTQVGTMFFCGSHPDAGMESVDMCPGHANVPGGHRPKPSRVGGGRAA